MMSHGFLKGMATGAAMGMGIALAVNPITEKDKKQFQITNQMTVRRVKIYALKVTKWY